MKIILISVIIVFSGLIGSSLKTKIKNELEILKIIKSYINYLDANISLFKTNIVEINYNYKIMQKNKTANKLNIYSKNNNKVIFELDILEKYIYKKDLFLTIKNYLITLGQNEYVYEKEKLSILNDFLSKCVEEDELEFKTKGSLWFKLSLAIGAVIGIILW